MRAVYQAEHLIDAHLVRGRLQAEGVEAHVLGEWLTGALGELPAGGLLAVCVAERDVERALCLLARWREEPPPEWPEEDDATPGDDGAGGALLA